MDDIEKEIDEELGKLNLDPFDNVSEESEDENYTAVDATVSAICIIAFGNQNEDNLLLYCTSLSIL